MDKTMMGQATEALAGKMPKKVAPKLHMSIHQLDDKKFHVKHEYRGGTEMMPDSEHAPANMKELKSHIETHFGGSPNMKDDASDWEQSKAADKEAQPKGKVEKG